MTTSENTSLFSLKRLLLSFFILSIFVELGAITSTLSYALIDRVSPPDPSTVIDVSIAVPCLVHDWRVNCQDSQICLGIYCTRYVSSRQANVSLWLKCDDELFSHYCSSWSSSSLLFIHHLNENYHLQNNSSNPQENIWKYLNRLTLSQPLYSIPTPSSPVSNMTANMTTCYLRKDSNIILSCFFFTISQ
nr:unnamed protein product [Naegleria fowleri]